MTHLERLEAGVCDDSVSLASLLRTVMLIGAHADSNELRRWALKELEGYPVGAEDLPDYRRIKAPLQMNISIGPEYHTGRGISSGMLPENMQELLTMDVPLTWGVAEIQASAEAERHGPNGTLHLGTQQGADIAQRISSHLRSTMGNRFVDVHGVYWAVPPSTLYGLLDIIRTRLTVFVAELRATLPPGDQDPSGALVAQAVQAMEIHVTAGDYSPVVIHSPQAQADDGTAEAITSQNPTDSVDRVVQEPPTTRWRRSR
ncbi:hypothetical protein ACEZCY_16535 [Streptacidiphilus sp. N1-12]|uniref:AbiTii domain-containing protein n=2 Tax=Streptacidiphilus alkalitolerans TaxID=3342712 RepID=A0ABV6VAJ1_9ACTN